MPAGSRRRASLSPFSSFPLPSLSPLNCVSLRLEAGDTSAHAAYRETPLLDRDSQAAVRVQDAQREMPTLLDLDLSGVGGGSSL